VHQAYPFARKISEDYYKIEITNHPATKNKAQSWQTLSSNQEFAREANKQILKEGFFKERENKYLHFTKAMYQ